MIVFLKQLQFGSKAVQVIQFFAHPYGESSYNVEIFFFVLLEKVNQNSSILESDEHILTLNEMY